MPQRPSLTLSLPFCAILPDCTECIGVVWKWDTSFAGECIYSIQENITIIIILILHNSLRHLTDPSTEIYRGEKSTTLTQFSTPSYCWVNFAHRQVPTSDLESWQPHVYWNADDNRPAARRASWSRTVTSTTTTTTRQRAAHYEQYSTLWL